MGIANPHTGDRMKPNTKTMSAGPSGGHTVHFTPPVTPTPSMKAPARKPTGPTNPFAIYD